ncbi:hypothetical protein NZA98_25580, partial [Escherichia coli]|nr:hypothetical protein [Escherichia coli]
LMILSIHDAEKPGLQPRPQRRSNNDLDGMQIVDSTSANLLAFGFLSSHPSFRYKGKLICPPKIDHSIA